MPNLLTMGRVCLAPFLVAAVLERKFCVEFVLFVVAGVTDGLDGTLARMLEQRTVLGQYLDPVADKVLLSTLFLVLTHMNLIPIRVTALVFGRDLGILVVAAILYAAVGRRDFKPSIFGKINTVAQVTPWRRFCSQQVDGATWVAGSARRPGRDDGVHHWLRPSLRISSDTAHRSLDAARDPDRRRRTQLEGASGVASASCAPTVCSISISRNSSESKTSPQSRHSTNSISSCRETIRTRGCLHTIAIVNLFFSEYLEFRLAQTSRPEKLPKPRSTAHRARFRPAGEFRSTAPQEICQGWESPFWQDCIGVPVGLKYVSALNFGLRLGDRRSPFAVVVGPPLNYDEPGRILNTDRSSRIFRC